MPENAPILKVVEFSKNESGDDLDSQTLTAAEFEEKEKEYEENFIKQKAAEAVKNEERKKVVTAIWENTKTISENRKFALLSKLIEKLAVTFDISSLNHLKVLMFDSETDDNEDMLLLKFKLIDTITSLNIYNSSEETDDEESVIERLTKEIEAL